MARAAAGAVAAPRPRKPAPKRVAGTASKRAAAPKAAGAGAKRAARKPGATRRPSVQRAAAARAPRRASGYAAGSAVALPLPARVANAPFARTLRVRGTRTLDALLAGRGWIVLVGVLLAGIVFFNVDLLKLNRDIAGTAEQIEQLKRQNDRFRDRVAHAASSERIQEAAALQGLVLPAPGDVRYLTAHPDADPRLAVKRYTTPSEALVAPVPVATTPTPSVTDPTALSGTATTTTTDPTATGTTTGVTDPTATGTTGTTTGVTDPTATGTTPTTTGTTGTTPSTGTTTGTTPPPTGTSTGTAVAPTG